MNWKHGKERERAKRQANGTEMDQNEKKKEERPKGESKPRKREGGKAGIVAPCLA